MRLLFEIDKKDYLENGTVTIRPSVRGIIIKDGKIAMIHSLKYDYYEFPGGGIEFGESQLDTLIREVKEESGLTVIRESVTEYGYVHRVEKGKKENIFIQDNYYYLCNVEDTLRSQNLDDYESEEQFTLEFVPPRQAVNVNQNGSHGDKENDFQFATMIEREVRVLSMLINEGLFD